ncbi:MAG: energy transducer TonB [Gammaproteobacteria bacterium]|nr:MAG: energy transducer TonB [Gammaproteobacteria bacterium]
MAVARVTPNDRLGMTLFLAAAVHTLLILGIGFDFKPRIPTTPPPLTLDITLVHHRSEEPPEQADYLAQASQDGGGNTEEKVRPEGPVSVPNIDPTPGNAPASLAEATPAPTPPPQPQTLARLQPEAELHQPPPTPPVEEPPRLTAAELYQRSRQMASLAAEISDSFRLHAERPRKKVVNARTQEYIYAAYMDAWQRKVERIGNLNYPDEAKRQRLAGSLLLQVDINPDGTVRDVMLLRSSGEKILDDAAVRIVRLSAPYAPFTPAMREEVDILQMLRTWQFLAGNRFATSNK